MPGQPKASPPLVLVPRLRGDRDSAELLGFIRAHPTVTLALERWCDLTGIGEGPVVARLLEEVAPVDLLDVTIASGLELGFAPDAAAWEPVRLRRVALCRGPLTLVEAENWYVPGRLPVDVASALETTSLPFGRLISELGGYRIDVRDLPERAADPAAPGQRPLFAQQAVVCAIDGTRLAVVRERFLEALLGPGPDHDG